MNILILEDELIISLELISILKELGYDNFHTAINYTEAIELYDRIKPDIAIIDINLSGLKTGIDFANYANKNEKIPFIYLTSNTDKSTIDEALKTKPNAYLPKPINKASLYSAIEIALADFVNANPDTIKITNALFFKEKGMFVKVPIENIIYFKGVGNYVDVVTKQKTYVLRASIGSILDANMVKYFVRTHKSYIANIKLIQSFNHDKVILNDKVEVPISNLYRAELLSMMKKIS